MTHQTSIQTIDSQTLRSLIAQGKTTLIDVREPAEYAGERIDGARLHPLSRLVPQDLAQYEDCILYCQSGRRSAKAAAQLAAAGFTRVLHLEGGLNAWKEAGFPLYVPQNGPISIMRQVQIVAGSLVLAGLILGVLVSPPFLFLSGFVGAGLTFSGITGTCAMGSLLAKLPYNQRGA